MTRTAIISDIHGELDRLRLVLADIEQRSIDQIVSLGDCVDERAGGVPVLKELLARGIPSVRGNCDGLCDVPRGSAEAAYIASMPPQLTTGDTVYTHISPAGGDRGIKDVRDAARAFGGSSQRLCFTGHIHIPGLFVEGGPGGPPAFGIPFEYGLPLQLDMGRRYIVCVGAVGKGRDGIAGPRYVVWDAARGTMEFVLVK